jgi:branched-chain amino acid transport system permease protein
MELSSLIVQVLNGLSQASSMFLVAAGLSLIFGVSRIVNFAHGSFFMLGVYTAFALTEYWGRSLGLAWSYWPLMVLTGLMVGLFGAVVEVVVLRPLYKSPEIFQLLATFALVLIIKDATLWLMGAEDQMGSRAPGLSGAVDILGRRIPSYDLFLIVIGPLVLALLWWLLKKTRFGVLIRAASQDREMVGALGVQQGRLFTAVFALGCALAGWAGALQLPKEPANLNLDMANVAEAFVVVVVGGLGSLPGAYVAALLIAQIKSLCIALGTVEILGVSFVFSKLTLVAEFLVMAVVLIFKPWGLMGKEPALTRSSAEFSHGTALANKLVLGPWPVFLLLVALVVLPLLEQSSSYTTVLAIDMLTATLFACSLYFLMGPGGMLSFGHAAFFGLGAYAASLLVLKWQLPMEWSLLLAPLITALFALFLAWFCVRLSGVYLAMLTLAFSQILWSICYQWDALTGGSNGLTGAWPSSFFSDKVHYYYLCLGLVALSLFMLRRVMSSPFGLALQAARDSHLRAQALGMQVKFIQCLAIGISGLFAGLSGALFAFSKGSISPDSFSVSKSVDALVMVLLGGVQSMWGPLLGAVSFTWLEDLIIRETPYWRACLGAVILLLVWAFPNGLLGIRESVGRLKRLAQAKQEQKASRP